MHRPLISRPLPARYYQTGGDIQWPQEVIDERNRLRLEAVALREQEVDFLRESAYKLGLAAVRLEDLRSDAGNGFAVVQHREGQGQVILAREENAEEFESEWAYLCQSPWAMRADDKIGCGWVKGVPMEKPYSALGPLSGSAGTHDLCQICGALIGENRQIVS